MPVADHAPRSGNDRHAGWGRRALLLAGPVVLAIGSIAWYLAGGRYVETDNAYLRADFVVVSPRIDGVVAVSPNIHVEGARPLFDVTTHGALLMPCAWSARRACAAST